MSTHPQSPFSVPYVSLEECFRLEAASEKRYDCRRGQVVRMSGGGYAQLKGGDCAPRTENAVVKNPLWFRPRRD